MENKPMKNVMKTVWATTIVVLTTPIIAEVIATPMQFILFTIGGNALIIYMVYKVLTDNYSTSKTFNDWYEDVPKQK